MAARRRIRTTIMTSQVRMSSQSGLLDVYPKIAEKNDDYKKSYEQLAKCMEPGIHENFVEGLDTAELVRFSTH